MWERNGNRASRGDGYDEGEERARFLEHPTERELASITRIKHSFFRGPPVPKSQRSPKHRETGSTTMRERDAPFNVISLPDRFSCSALYTAWRPIRYTSREGIHATSVFKAGLLIRSMRLLSSFLHRRAGARRRRFKTTGRGSVTRFMWDRADHDGPPPPVALVIESISRRLPPSCSHSEKRDVHDRVGYTFWFMLHTSISCS